MAVYSALQLAAKQISDWAVVPLKVLAPEPVGLVAFCFTRNVFVLLVSWLLGDAVLYRGRKTQSQYVLIPGHN